MTLRVVVTSCFLTAVAAVAAAPASVPDNGAIKFIGIGLDAETQTADHELCDYLQKATGTTIGEAPETGYASAIDTVVNWKPTDGSYLARLTPFAYIAAELRGADFDVLGTYLSKATMAYTYHSYFVVRALDMYTELYGPLDSDGLNEKLKKIDRWKPSIDDVKQYLMKKRRKFVYHDKFSASSYFVPSLYFHDSRVLLLQTESGKKMGDINPIVVAPLLLPNPGSSDAVEEVRKGSANKEGSADIAAVWDGTLAKYPPSVSPDLRFIKLDQAMPNDLLVCSRSMPPEMKANIRRAIADMERRRAEPFSGDFVRWKLFDDAPGAPKALAELRQRAVPQKVPVTVKIVPYVDDAATNERYRPYIEATKHAVTFARTELMLYDKDFHDVAADITWRIELIHKNTLKLTSTIDGFGRPRSAEQTFEISFVDTEEDLPRRVEWFIHNRMNRIRYIWPFDTHNLTVLRDVNFSLPDRTPLVLQKITWQSPERNNYLRGGLQGEEIVKQVDLQKFVLSSVNFPRDPQSAELLLDPMSNVVYRVVLVRPDPVSPLFRYLTIALVLLFVATAGAVILEVRMRRAVLQDGEAVGSRVAPAVAPALSGISTD